MSGPRDPDEFERRLYVEAAKTRNERELRGLLAAYPNIVWGSVTRTLGEAEQQWVRETLRSTESASEVDHAW